MMKKMLTVGSLATLLMACDSGIELAKDISTLLGAATDHPCAGDFAYQTELNGVATDIKSTSEVVGGETMITEQHWYSDLSMIVYYTYQENDSWCNMWNEGGVDWIN